MKTIRNAGVIVSGVEEAVSVMMNQLLIGATALLDGSKHYGLP
ncbi:hypothetical protein [Labrenzia sp. PHM005]|nr:hypothetical protein [Labrenzia sp. PHM005]